ncbi:MFS general substrate transporter [Phlebopus sp. FC_14]|nr:MFS general substrate transporter [Phlebopus sp. FC_14]
MVSEDDERRQPISQEANKDCATPSSSSTVRVNQLPEKVQQFLIEFDDDDPRDPENFSPARKWAITLIACGFTGIVASASTSFSIGYQSMTRDLNCTQFQATVAFALFALGFGVVPLVTSSFSEEVGRSPLYWVCSLAFMLTELMIALAPNIQTVMIARLLGGGFGSTGATLVGGTVADIWRPQERGMPMSIFSFAAVAGTGLGPVVAGWIEANPSLAWRWIQWVHVIFTGVYFLAVVVILTETRSSIILTRIAQKMRKQTGDDRYRAQAEIDKQNLLTLIKISCTRPLYLLVTEPAVLSFSVWVGFVWGVVFALMESVSPEFQSIYGFGIGETGLVFVTLVLGSIIGFLANMCQEKLYHEHYARKKQEARLYLVCFTALFLPIGMFIYAWTASPAIPWIVPVIGLLIFMTGVYVIYQTVFLYLADCYGAYASSALAGQSLARNIAAVAFPLFTEQMFARLTYKWALTLFGFVALVMAPIPCILFFYGVKVRSRSKVSRLILEAEARRTAATIAETEKSAPSPA